jgi:hypothetical protein
MQSRSISPLTLVLPRATYHITVYEYEDRGLMKIEYNGDVIWQKGGYVRSDTALEDGEKLARDHHYHHFERDQQ